MFQCKLQLRVAKLNLPPDISSTEEKPYAYGQGLTGIRDS